ncbi:MAG: hypothetical protein IMX05_01395 [Hydrogenibacillus schlegelii]|nr:hypothetical protein [Hydrogenibacillus schlegelii]
MFDRDVMLLAVAYAALVVVAALLAAAPAWLLIDAVLDHIDALFSDVTN